MSDSAGAADEPLSVVTDGGSAVLRLAGRWTLETVLAVDGTLRREAERLEGSVVLDAAALSGLDSAGAWAIQRTMTRLTARGLAAELRGVPDAYRAILEKAELTDPDAPVAPPVVNPILAALERCGRAVEHGLGVGRALSGFLGYVLVGLGSAVVSPRR